MTAKNLFKEDLGQRRYDLDWVRIGAFMLLILYHVGMYYVTWDWHVKSPQASATIEPLMMLSSPWRLSLLFLVSGVATGFLLARQGSTRFLRLRSRLNHDNAARRYLTGAIFPVYILHQTVIVVVAHALKPSHLYPPVEGVLLVLVTAATCFLSYEAIRRVRLLRPLFGLEGSTPGPQILMSRRDTVAVRQLAPELCVPQDIN